MARMYGADEIRLTTVEADPIVRIDSAVGAGVVAGPGASTQETNTTVSASPGRKGRAMSKTKVILLGLLAAFAVCAISSTTASAATHEFKVEGKEITEKIPYDQVTRNLRIFFTQGHKLYYQYCPEDTARGNFIPPNKDEEEIVAFNCQVFDLENGKKVFQPQCVVKEKKEILFAKTEQIAHGIDQFKGSETEEKFGEITFEKGTEACAIEGTYKLKGEILCAMPEAEFEKVLHEFICTPAGSNIKLQKEEKTEDFVLFYDQGQSFLQSSYLGQRWSAT
jgi:hypothetical protein